MNQQQEQDSSPRHHAHDDTRLLTSSAAANMTFQPELVSGHHLNSSSFHSHMQRPALLTQDHQEIDTWGRQTLTAPHSYLQHHQHHHHTQQHGLHVSDGANAVYGARVSTSGSSFNSDSLSSVGSVLNHAHRMAHSEYCKSLTRGEGGKKVSFVNPTDSLIIYGGGTGAGCAGDEIKSTDTQV